MPSNNVVWGPNNIGPVELVQPTDDRIRELIIKTANDRPGWGPIRIYDELRAVGANLTQANVHWVLRKSGLRTYTTT